MMRNLYTRPMLIVLSCLLLLAGCSRAIVQSENPAPIDADQYRACFDEAVWVLRDNGFVIDRKDYRFGTITTRPLGSPNLFEPWHAQNTTADQAIESTLSSEQRTVSVTITEMPATDLTSQAGKTGYTIEVNVTLQRQQAPTRRLAGSAQRNVFSNLAAPPRELADKGISGTYWEPVGRDPYLEARLMKQIIERTQGAQP